MVCAGPEAPVLLLWIMARTPDALMQQCRRGLFTWRRNTVTSCRSTRISAFLDCALRVSSPSQAMTCRKIRYSSRTATIDVMPNHHCPAMPQVTAMDGQFGTHTVMR